MLKPKILFLFILLVVGIFFSALWFKNMNTQNEVDEFATQNNERKVYLGIWTGKFRDTEKSEVVPSAIQEFEEKVNRKFAIAHFYRGWEFMEDYTMIRDLEQIQDNHWTPMVSVSPYSFEQCGGGTDKKNLYKKIASGECDTFLHSAGNNMARLEKPIFFRFAWEMNVNTIEWSVQKFEDTPQDYVQAWQRMHTIFREEGANKLVWVFSPNIIIRDSIPYNELYPGDNYVDWVGLDGYNWGDTKSWSTWQNFNQVFRKSYEAITSIAPGKPLMLAEVNSVNTGGDKALWYKDMLEVQIPNKYPKVKAVVFFDENKESQEGVNWTIDITPEALNAFKNGIHNPLYQSALPKDFNLKLN